MENKRDEATVTEIIEVISKIILEASVNKFNDKDVEKKCPS